MGLEVGLAAAAVGDVRVALGRAEVGVAEHLLDGAEVGAALEQMRGERVAEQVRMDALGLEPGLPGEAPQDQEGARPGQRPAAGVQEQLGPVAPVEVGAAERQVAAHRFRSRTPERDEPLLTALAERADDPLLQVDSAPLEADGLRDAQPGSVQELDERAVAQRARRRPGGGLDQPFRLGRG